MQPFTIHYIPASFLALGAQTIAKITLSDLLLAYR